MTCSFETFLVRYCNQLTGTGKRVRSIAKLVSLCDEHPRAYEPVTVLAALWGRGDILLETVQNPDRLDKCRAFLDGYAAYEGSLLDYLERLGEEDPFERHYRTLEAWRAESMQREIDEEIKADLARKIAGRVEKTGLGEAARTCGVNKGNLWAFANGDLAKMSLNTALKTMATLRKATASQ